MAESLNALSAVEVREAVLRGALSCEQVARACLNRIAEREPHIKAWAYCDPDRVLAEARALDRSTRAGLMKGVPIGVKDVINTFDMPTQMGSPIYRNDQPPADAACVALLRSEGAIIIGKTVTCEFAGPAPGTTTNPHNLDCTPGGSSSGSAAAVADFMVPLALGTQTGGSVVRPASYCGIVGYKPSYGLISTAGVHPAAPSLDTVGLMARCVEDIALSARVLMNARATDWLPPHTKLRVGLCQTPFWNAADEASQHAVTDAASRLSVAGHQVHPVNLPDAFHRLSETREIVNDYERARAMAHDWRHHSTLISPALAAAIRRGMDISMADYTGALRLLEECRLLLAPLFDDVDIVLTPAVSGEAEVGLSSTGSHLFQSLWTQMRVPTITLPTAVGPRGLPVGIQLVGPSYGDGALLAAARLMFDVLGSGPIVHIK